MRLQGFTLTFAQFKGDAAGNVFMKIVETDRQAVCWRIWGREDFFPNLKLELRQCHSLSLHSTPWSPWARHGGRAPALTGAAGSPKARPRCPRGAFNCPPPLSSPTQVNFPATSSQALDASRKEEGKWGHPQAFVPGRQDQRPAQPRLATPSLRRLLVTCSCDSFPFPGAPG